MKQKEQMQYRDGKVSYSNMVLIYLLICIIGILASLPLFNQLVQRHDSEITGKVCRLVAEKMNNSIAYMTKSVENSATLLGAQDISNFEQVYQELLNSVEEADYSGIGLIDNQNRIYGLEAEIQEIEKWDLLSAIDGQSGVVISEPYRSGVNGKMVITMFAPIYRTGVKKGTIFVIYPLEEIQNMANTAVLSEETEIYLMNPFSDNFIRCFGVDHALIGSWNNMKLYRNQIKDVSFNSYSKWEESMQSGAQTGDVQFQVDDVLYTQVFESIAAMRDWFVVVRIPSKSLSNTMRLLQTSALFMVGILFFATMIMLALFHTKEVKERKVLEHLSLYDGLTQVMNRQAFEFYARAFLEKEKSAVGAVIYTDIDYFKQVNDRFGHDGGDKALVAYAGALMTVFGGHGIVARIGGDEFAVLIKHMKSKKWMEDKLEQLRRCMADFHLKDSKEDGEEFHLHFSAGISVFPENGNNLDILTKCADAALYEVKERGRNGYGWFKQN